MLGGLTNFERELSAAAGWPPTTMQGDRIAAWLQQVMGS
jgi:hypothetical protein